MVWLTRLDWSWTLNTQNYVLSTIKWSTATFPKYTILRIFRILSYMGTSLDYITSTNRNLYFIQIEIRTASTAEHFVSDSKHLSAAKHSYIWGGWRYQAIWIVHRRHFRREQFSAINRSFHLKQPNMICKQRLSVWNGLVVNYRLLQVLENHAKPKWLFHINIAIFGVTNSIIHSIMEDFGPWHTHMYSYSIHLRFTIEF